MEALLAFINQSKIMWGVSMLLLNIGARYVILDLGKAHELILSSDIVKKIIVLCMFFVGTRDIVISFLLTIAYVIIIDGMLHENRRFCILPKSIAEKARGMNAHEHMEQYEDNSSNLDPKKDAYSRYITNIKRL